MSPYRSKPERNHAGPRIDDERWRRRTSFGALALIVLVVATVLSTLIAVMLRRWGVSETTAYSLVETLVFASAWLVAVWLYTTPRPAPEFARTKVAAWSLRTVAVAPFAFDLALLLFPAQFAPPVMQEGARHAVPASSLYWVAGTVPVLMLLLGLEYLRAMFKELNRPHDQRTAFWLLIAPIAAPIIPLTFALLACRMWVALFAVMAFAAIVWTVGGFMLVLTLRRVLRVTHHEWWLAENELPDYEWASLVVLGDSRAEVLTADGKRHGFEDDDEAAEWLTEAHFLPEAVARRRGLVSWVPPAPIG